MPEIAAVRVEPDERNYQFVHVQYNNDRGVLRFRVIFATYSGDPVTRRIADSIAFRAAFIISNLSFYV